MDLAQRFWSKVERRRWNQCWEWQAGKTIQGYGKFRMPTSHVPAHRMAWMLHHDQAIPEGGWILHHCDNPPCCNPRHLYLGTSKENSQDRERRGRGNRKVKTHCKYGHPFTEENTYTTYPPSFGGGAFRQCRTCMRRRQREYQDRLRKEQQT